MKEEILANTSAAQKAMRASRAKQTRNQPVETLCKSSIGKAEKQIFAGELESAKEQVTFAIRTLDKAAEKGIIHPNNAARRKSRLMHKLNAAQKPPEPKAEKTEPAK